MEDEEALHYRIIRRGNEITVVLTRPGGTYYDKFEFLSEDRYPNTKEGMWAARVVAEAMNILVEGA